MKNVEMTAVREDLLEKFDKMLPSDDSINTVLDSSAICIDAISDEELSFLMEQHEENVKILANRTKK